MTTMTPFLMFQGGQADPALDFYVATVPDSRIVSLERRGAGTPGEGTVLSAVVEIAGQRVMVSDSYVAHDFGFTPAISLFLDCADDAELDRLFAALSDGGAVLMPLADYGFSRRFGWCDDRFGVSWQVNLA